MKVEIIAGKIYIHVYHTYKGYLSANTGYVGFFSAMIATFIPASNTKKLFVDYVIRLSNSHKKALWVLNYLIADIMKTPQREREHSKFSG